MLLLLTVYLVAHSRAPTGSYTILHSLFSQTAELHILALLQFTHKGAREPGTARKPRSGAPFPGSHSGVTCKRGQHRNRKGRTTLL